MKRKAYLLVFDGLADWEPAHALCEINKSGKFEVVPVGFSMETVCTMGGLKVSPETTIEEVRPAEAAIFMMPGGDMWERGPTRDVKPLLDRLRGEAVPIAAICAATLEIARAGFTHQIHHTSNDRGYLKAMVPGYRDEEFYVEELAVSEKNLITASGLGSVEFAREIIRQLNIYSEADTQLWFEMFKQGVIPPAYRAAEQTSQKG
jgi:putative intracellular protease/amidase